MKSLSQGDPCGFSLSYKKVTKILVENDATLCEQYAVLLPMLEEMKALQEILERKRMRRGAIEFHAPESKVDSG